jgi:CheY-like chemotaxis protein
MSRILLAEDDRVSRVMLQAVLAKWGHEVVAAVDGEQALASISASPGVDVAILDWMMPGLTGPEVCRRARTVPGLRPLHIILLTSKSRGVDAAEAIDAGADDYVHKPYDLIELQARIRLGLRRLESVVQAPPGQGGPDFILQRILSRFSSLNRVALESVLRDPALLPPHLPAEGGCDLSLAIPSIVESASGLLSDRVTVSVHGDGLEVAASEAAVRQIALNVLVHVRTASLETPSHLDIYWHEADGWAVLRLEDDGPQVNADDLPMLVWPVTGVRRQGGAPGFGLFFAEVAAQGAGGSLSCASLPVGLRTEIRLPLR